jgi:CRP-like cAMP-binding protein
MSAGSVQPAFSEDAMPPLAPLENRILASLPAADFQRLTDHLQPVTLEARKIIYPPRSAVPYAYFPTSALISVQRGMEDGRLVEVGSIGREGLAGIRAVFGDVSPQETFMVQVPGEAYQMEAGPFIKAARAEGPFRDLVFRYTSALLSQYGQWVACNILHTVEQRTARWLTMVRDRTGMDEFPLTHEFLAQMLGVRRASVTEVARTLQKEGLIRYRRGQMSILDPHGLERAACECYRHVKRDFERLFGFGK